MKHEQPNVEIDVSSPTVIKVDFGLTWRQITIAFGFIATLIGGGGFAGWLVLPASKTDLVAVERMVTAQIEALKSISAEVRELQRVSVSTADALDDLREAVNLLSDQGAERPPVAPIARPRPPLPVQAPTGSKRKPDRARPPDAWREGELRQKRSRKETISSFVQSSH